MSTGGLPQQRRKVVTYGKTKRAVFNPFGLDSPSPKKTRPQSSAIKRAPSPSTSSHPGVNASPLRTNHPGVSDEFVFNVPSSDDETTPRAPKLERLTAIPRPPRTTPLKTAVVSQTRPKPQHRAQYTRPSTPDVNVYDGPDTEDRKIAAKTSPNVVLISLRQNDATSNNARSSIPPVTTAKIPLPNGAKTKALLQAKGQHAKPKDSQVSYNKRSQRENLVFDVPSGDTEMDREKHTQHSVFVPKPGRVKRNPHAQMVPEKVKTSVLSNINSREAQKGSDDASRGAESKATHLHDNRMSTLKARRTSAKDTQGHSPLQKTKKSAQTLTNEDASVFDVPSTDTEDEVAKNETAKQSLSFVASPNVKRTMSRGASQQNGKDPLEPVTKRTKPSPQIEATSGRQQLSQKNLHTTVYPRRAVSSSARNRKPPIKATSSPSKLQIAQGLASSSIETYKLDTSGPFDVEFETEINPFDSEQQDQGSPMNLDGPGSVTPKQKRLWNNLLDDNVATSSPSQLQLQNLQLTASAEKRKSPDVLDGGTQLNPRPGKKRLIDRLIQSNQESSDESSSDDDSFRTAPTDTIGDSQTSNPPTLVIQTSFKRKRSGPTGARITYAKQRSHLEESMVEGGDILGAMTMGSPILSKPSARSWSQPLALLSQETSQFDMDDDDLSDSGGGMKSIHELRTAGANRQFNNEVDGLFEDLDQPKKASLSSRRSALIDLAVKLADKKFVSKLLDKGLSRRIFNSHVADYSQDPILGFAFSACVSFILSANKSTAVLADIRDSETLQCLGSLLDHTDDVLRIAKDRRTNMSRMAQKAVSDLHETVKSSPALWAVTSSTSISPRLLALRSLELSTRSLRKAGDRDELLAQDQLAKVLNIAESSSSSSLTGSVAPLDQRCVFYSLSVALDTMLGDTASEVWSHENLQRFRDIAASFLDTPPRFGPKVEQLATKLCLNLTNNNAETSEMFASVDIVQSFLRSIDTRFKLVSGPLDNNERTIAVDHLVLGLGAMINLAEFSDTARLAVIEGGDVLLNALLRLHMDGHKKVSEAESLEESNTNVAFGYLSVLMANLCQNQRIRKKIRQKLPEGNLGSLISSLAQFVNMQVMANSLNSEGDEGRELWTSYTTRLIAVFDRLKEHEQTEK